MRSTCCVLLSLLLLLALRGTAGAVEIGTNFWDVGWGGEVNDPFETTHKNVQGENPWNTEFLNEIRIYTVFRFMDWGENE